jgi:hypothetical protein
MYSPIIPRANNCTPPMNMKLIIKEVQPEIVSFNIKLEYKA